MDKREKNLFETGRLVLCRQSAATQSAPPFTGQNDQTAVALGTEPIPKQFWLNLKIPFEKKSDPSGAN